jgi:hypothetical protein
MSNYDVLVESNLHLQATVVDLSELPPIVMRLLQVDLHERYSMSRRMASTLATTPPPTMTMVHFVVIDGQRHRNSKPQKRYPLEDASPSPVMHLSKQLFCQTASVRYDGEWYAYLMSHPLKRCKKDTNVGYSRNPIQSVYKHNHHKLFDKETAIAAPHWRLDNTLGPFLSKVEAVQCAENWVCKTRGIPSKRERAKVLAARYKVPLYSSEVVLEQPFHAFLCSINAPDSLLDACLELKQQSLALAPRVEGQ